MSLLVLFLDGVGLGPNDATNPLARASSPTLRALLGSALTAGLDVERDGVVLASTDATLDLPGLPQSATGQTTLLTGRNAAAVAGRHVTAYPTAELRALLAEESLFAVLSRRGRRTALANAYSPEYFAAVRSRRLRMSAVTYAAHAAGVRLRTLDDLRGGEAVFHDLTNARLRQWGHDVSETTPHECGRRLAQIAAGADFAFFEFFLSDLAAHGRLSLASDDIVTMADGLLGGALDARPPGLTVVLTSDHGNLEDGRSALHTRNPVPTLAVGPQARRFSAVRSLVQFAPAVLAALDEPAPLTVPERAR